MKQLLLIGLLLIACTPEFVSNQQVKIIEAQENVTVVSNITSEQNITSTQPEVVQPKQVQFTNSTWINQGIPLSGSTRSGKHVIELIDVDDNERGCLIRVDSSTVLIDEDESTTINNVKIHVLDVRAFKSYSQDNDACQVIIS